MKGLYGFMFLGRACALLVFVVLLGGGCSHRVREAMIDMRTEPFASTNYRLSAPSESWGRVAVLPVYSEWPDDVGFADALVLEELGKARLFDCVGLSGEVLQGWYGAGALDVDGRLPADLLMRVREHTGADAVLLLSVTSYSPYRPVAVGLRGRMVRVGDGATVWAYDEVLDSGDMGVSLAARRYHSQEQRQRFPLDGGDGVLLSPRRFFRYVLWNMVSTMNFREKV